MSSSMSQMENSFFDKMLPYLALWQNEEWTVVELLYIKNQMH